jgi:hypothetical protein
LSYFSFSTDWWEVAKNRFGSVFEATENNADYSLAGLYGAPPAQDVGTNPQQQQQQQQYSSQQQQPPAGYQPPQQRGYPPQQQQPGQFGYRPPNQPGQPGIPPQNQGRPGYPQNPSTDSYPPHLQQQSQPGQQQQGQQQQQQTPPGRFPPGYTPPQPRSDAAYPMQQQHPLATRPGQQGPPLQGQWRGGPPPTYNNRGYPQQQSPFDPRTPGTFTPQQQRIPGQQIPVPQQPNVNETPSDVEKKEESHWFDHPGLSGGF